MKYTVIVKPKKSFSSVEVIDDSHLSVSVTQPPIDGRANAGVIIVLAKHFHVSPNKVNIITGSGSRVKIVEITD